MNCSVQNVPLWIIFTASCRLVASQHPLGLLKKKERKKEKDHKPEFPREPAAWAPLPQSWAPPACRFLNMMNCVVSAAARSAQGSRPRLLGQPVSPPRARLLHASRRRHCRCCCIASVLMQASQITERDVSTARLGRAERRGGCCRVGRNRLG